MHGKDYVNTIIKEKEEIVDFLYGYSADLCGYIRMKEDSTFFLFYKMLSHSDLATYGKAKEPDSLDKNYLYYLNEDQMRDFEIKWGCKFHTAHQSNIGLRDEFYELAGLPKPRDTKPYCINDSANVYLVNKNVEFFKSEYTQKVFKVLNKKPKGNKWDFDNIDVILSEESGYTPIDLHCAVHGIGTSLDTEFDKLRHHMFKGDSFILLFEKTKSGNKNIFIVLSKNPAFFPLVEVDDGFGDYVKKEDEQKCKNAQTEGQEEQNEDEPFKGFSSSEDVIRETMTRAHQAEWRERLAEEMMAHTPEGKVYCPFTNIEADYNKWRALFIASHIKGYSDKNTTDREKYDLNNGLLLSRNADALFDRHLITVDENRKLRLSFLIKDDKQLLEKLWLSDGQPVSKSIFNDKRMHYMDYHRSYFEKMEDARQINEFIDNEMDDIY